MQKLTTLTGWLVMAAAFIAGITACSKVDNTIYDPATTETPKTYTMTVTASKGDDATTRALSIDGKTLNATWTAGDVVQVYSVIGEGYAESESSDPVGTLTAQSSGVTTTLTGEFVSTYTPTVGAKLRLRFNENPDYTTQEGTLDYIATHCDYAVADITVSTVDAVTGDVTATATASFANQQAVVKFSLKQSDGTTPVAAKSLTLTVGSTTYNVTPTAAASDFYVAVRKASNKAVSLSANTSTGNFSYDKTGITFENGKYYAIGVKMARIPTQGDLYYSDGTFSWTLEDGKTPIGVIAYVGTDVFTENGVTLRDGTTTLQSQGLVLCLRNIADVQWKKGQSEGGPAEKAEFSSDAIVNDRGDLLRTTDVSGYANTKFLAEKTDSESNYSAAYQAWNYSLLTAPATTTGWFMPTIQQWVKILTGLGEMSESDIAWMTWKDNSLNAIHNLEAAMGKAGEKGMAYDGMSDSNRYYWSCSESTASAATTIVVYPTVTYGQQGLFITSRVKSHDENHYVRPVLAF